MAFADAQTISINGSAIPLSRVITGTTTGLFPSEDGNTFVEITPSVSKGRRHTVVRLNQKKTTVDPLVGSTNVRVSDFMSINIQRPLEGYSNDEVLQQLLGLIAWGTAGTNANFKKLIAGEN